MGKFFTFFEHTLWGVAGLAFSLIILFAVLHFLKQNSLTGGAASWIGSHAQNY